LTDNGLDCNRSDIKNWNGLQPHPGITTTDLQSNYSCGSAAASPVQTATLGTANFVREFPTKVGRVDLGYLSEPTFRRAATSLVSDQWVGDGTVKQDVAIPSVGARRLFLQVVDQVKHQSLSSLSAGRQKKKIQPSMLEGWKRFPRSQMRAGVNGQQALFLLFPQGWIERRATQAFRAAL